MRWCLPVFFLSAAALAVTTASSQYEAEISEIQLAYHTKDIAKASTLVDSLLRMAPTLPEALEMKALILATKNDRGAISQFDQLIEQRKREGRTKEVAEYELMAGRLAYRLKENSVALTRLGRAVKEPSAAGAAAYYMGLIQREQGNIDAARESFSLALDSENYDVKPSAQYQLSQIDAASNNADAAVRGLIRARGLASERLKYRGSSAAAKDLALQVQRATGRELQPLEESTLLVNAGLMTGYDTNVLSVPNGSTSGASVPSAASLVQTLNYGIIYATSPGDDFQFVPSYRGSFNYNFNNDTRNAQFLLNDIRINITKDALQPTNYGIKLGATMGFQYQVDPDTNNGRLGAYSLQGSFGPYVRTPFNNAWSFVGELYFQPKKMYLDDSFSTTLRESGWEQYARAMFVRTSATTYWNPGVAVSGAWTQTNGEEFRGRRIALDFGNTFNLSKDFLVGASATISATWYPDRLNGARRDQGLNFTASSGYRISDELNLLMQLSALGNYSNVSAYRFNRIVASFGGNYLF